MTARLTASSINWYSSAWNSTRPQCGYPWGAFGTVENAHSQRFSVSGQSGFENTQGRVRRPLSLSPHAGKPRCVAPKRRSADCRNAADSADGADDRNAADGRNPAGEYALPPCAGVRRARWRARQTGAIIKPNPARGMAGRGRKEAHWVEHGRQAGILGSARLTHGGCHRRRVWTIQSAVSPCLEGWPALPLAGATSYWQKPCQPWKNLLTLYFL